MVIISFDYQIQKTVKLVLLENNSFMIFNFLFLIIKTNKIHDPIHLLFLSGGRLTYRPFALIFLPQQDKNNSFQFETVTSNFVSSFQDILKSQMNLKFLLPEFESAAEKEDEKRLPSQGV